MAGMVNLTGTLNNRGTELALNTANGSWQLAAARLGRDRDRLGRGEVAGDV